MHTLSDHVPTPLHITDQSCILYRTVAIAADGSSLPEQVHGASARACSGTIVLEQAEARELQQEQCRLTGAASGYRPASVTPWIWDTEQTVEGVRWSYSHTRELTLTANVARGVSTVPFPLAMHQLDLAKVAFDVPERDVYGSQASGTPRTELGDVPHTVDSMLAATHADAFLVLHRGAIVTEQYLHGASARTKRLGMSMTKTYTSMLVGILAEQGEAATARSVHVLLFASQLT